MSTTTTLTDGLFDDAAMFPPGNASAETAVREHLTHRDSWYSRLIGPLLVSANRWAEFVSAHESLGQPPLEVVVIGTAERPTPVPAAVSIAGFELVAPDDVAELMETAGAVAIELPRLDALDQVLDQVTELRVRGIAAVAKYRTGGTEVAAFPSARDVATVLAAAVLRELPVKFTAGLHHPVRHRDPETGFEHHGFLNLLWGVVVAQQGGSGEKLVSALEERDPAVVRQVVASWPPGEVAAARAVFTSFGCCDVLDPVADLVALGLIAEESR